MCGVCGMCGMCGIYVECVKNRRNNKQDNNIKKYIIYICNKKIANKNKLFIECL